MATWANRAKGIVGGWLNKTVSEVTNAELNKAASGYIATYRAWIESKGKDPDNLSSTDKLKVLVIKSRLEARQHLQSLRTQDDAELQAARQAAWDRQNVLAQQDSEYDEEDL